MSEKIVKLITCNRCSNTCMLDYIGTEHFDGGYTSEAKFKKLPDGWGVQSRIGMLCPACNEEYGKLMEQFMR